MYAPYRLYMYDHVCIVICRHTGGECIHRMDYASMIMYAYVHSDIVDTSSSAKLLPPRTGSRSELNRRVAWTEQAEASDLDLHGSVDANNGFDAADRSHRLRAFLGICFLMFPIIWQK